MKTARNLLLFQNIHYLKKIKSYNKMIMIIFYKTVEINAHISLLDVEGVVVDIDLRYTTIQGPKAKHLIPNSRLLSETITIFNKKTITNQKTK